MVQNIIYYSHKTIVGSYRRVLLGFNQIRFHFLLYIYSVEHHNFRCKGAPFISVHKNGILKLGRNFSINSGMMSNLVGTTQKAIIVVKEHASVIIGNNVGISQSSLIAYADIIVGDNVKIGGGCCILTSDFHSLDPKKRSSSTDIENVVNKPVVLGDNVFIGARSVILKGVNIGENSIIGAGSVVAKSIPPNQIWAGNPAKFIREIKI